MKTQEPLQDPANFDNIGLPPNERILEEEDWLDDGNDFWNAEGNDFGEEDGDLMEEDDLLGEELQIVEAKHVRTMEESGIENSNMGTVSKIMDGFGSSEMAIHVVDSKSKTPRKNTNSTSIPVSAPSTRKKKGSRSPSTVGVSLRQRNLLSGLGSPKVFSASHGPNGSIPGQLGPSSSVDKKRPRDNTQG
ncbi:unnamed protein product [Eruca vesicaria subsp. sativa]|uniref:Uncharacterized protein n=1 Tax=Eruca vesicaria subsp. sativa TaxID=29727 RepID=A0ABC8LWT1_ERUVS|nr:unnamed protein product [Eruca vesicaria subsp. sativa]